VLAQRAAEDYAVLTLDGPEAMNALPAAPRRGVADAIAELAAEPPVGVLILTGAGWAFWAGLDLSRLIGSGRAKALSLTGNFLGARQAEAWGLVNRVLPAGELLPAARTLARDMLSALPDMLPAMKRLIDDGYALPFAEAMALERERSQAHRARVTGEAVAGRVDAVVAHGKTQSSG
jgi:enoyl-CoA hydratase/carnithine racemase